MKKIPDRYRDLLDRPVVLSPATLLCDSAPRVPPVWCSCYGQNILVNTEKGRQKCRNLPRDVCVPLRIAPQRVVTMETSMPLFSEAN